MLPPSNTPNLASMVHTNTELEAYIIKSVMEGQVIDLEKWITQNPSKEISTQITSDFFSEFFSSKHHQTHINHKGFKIKGLNAPNISIHMHFTELTYPIEFENCSFENLTIQGVTTKALLKFTECNFKQVIVRNLVTEDDFQILESVINKLRFDNIRVYGDLILRGTQASSIKVYGGKVVGEFSLRLTEVLEAELASLEVKGVTSVNEAKIHKLEINGGCSGRLFRAYQAKFGAVQVTSFNTFGDFDCKGSTVSEYLRIMSIDVLGNALFNEMTINKIEIWGGHFKGVVQISDSKVLSALIMQRSHVEGTLFLRNTILSCDADFSFINIDNSLSMESLSFSTEGNSFDLTGVEILGDLRFYQDDDQYIPHPWGNQKLILRNCTTKSFQDHPEIWPNEIDFTGFEYQQITGRNKNSSKKQGTVNFADRPISWIIGLLARQKNFNPQPYWQLAKVLGQIGYEQKSTQILYECAKERRKNNPSFFARNFKRFHFMINGYGYYNFRVLYWCVLFIICGMGVLHQTGEGQRLNLNYGFLYSIDMLIPLVEFNKKYYTESYALQNYPAELYFFFHELMGYLFAVMVASGMSKLSRENR